MKTMKKLIPALAMLLVSAVLLGTSTFAWFSMNTRVTATGMQINAKTSSSLVISKALNVGNQTTVEFTAAANNLIPATHDLTAVAVNSSIDAVHTDTTTTGLKYNTNPQNVGSATGYANSATALTFAKAANGAGNYYYEDYTVYIASAGVEMTNTKLQVYLYTNAAVTADTTKATTVDFYVSQDSTNMGKYVGSINLSSLTDTPTIDGDATYYTAPLDITLSDKKIPQNGKADDYIQITMRVYYDGALQKTASTLAVISAENTKAASATTYYDQYGNIQDVVVGETVVTGMYTGTPAQAYVYSDLITTTGTAFKVSFKTADDT